MEWRVGTSGYGYKEWKGKFYPEKLPQKDMLGYYAERFNSVELNNTFWRMPTTQSLNSLCEQVASSFCFAIKAPQSITHFKRLRGAEGDLKALTEALGGLSGQSGPVLFQLPPNFKKDLERLNEFLALLDKSISAAFEFRHESWFDAEVYDALREHSCALCAADDEDTPPAQLVKTVNWGYVRLRRVGYTPKELATWFKNISSQGWSEVFVYFKHEETGTGPKLAANLLKLIGQ